MHDADKPKPNRQWWTIGFARPAGGAEKVEYRTDVLALNAVEQYRQLDDPDYKPVELFHHQEFVRVTIDPYPLTTSVDKVTAEVTRRLLEHAKENDVPTGQAGIEFAVKTTMEVLDEQ